MGRCRGYLATPRPPAEWLKEMPIYAIHGDKDLAVIPQNSQQAVQILTKLGVKTRTQPWKDRGGPELARLSAWLLAHQRAHPAELTAAEKRLTTWGKQFGWSPEGGPLGKYTDARREISRNSQNPCAWVAAPEFWGRRQTTAPSSAL